MEAVYSFVSYFSPGFVAWLQSSKYILLFFGSLFEGPVVMVATGFLFRLGQVELLPAYVALVAGDFTADIGWYCVGRFGARNLIYRWGKHFGITPDTIGKIEDRFHKYHDKIIIISKLTMGLGFALVILIVAGMLHMPFKKYVTLNLIGGFVWVAVLLVVGYFFGNVYALITGPEKIIFAVCGLLIFFFGIRWANGYLAKQEL